MRMRSTVRWRLTVLYGALFLLAGLVLLGVSYAIVRASIEDELNRERDQVMVDLIEAGADLFLMPSRFEPCGLNQMYSLRYGTVPVVRAVGGLADTVRDPLNSVGGGENGSAATGFVFYDYTPGALLETLRRALASFKKPRTWKALQRAGMKRDHSWDRSAREYVKIYERVSATAPPVRR